MTGGFLTELERKTLSENINFTAIRDGRFKNNQISVNFLMPLKKETAALHALIPLVLKRGCRPYPNMTLLNRRLKELYGARLDGGVGKRGEMQVISLYCAALDDTYALEGETLLRECAGLLKSVLFDPIVTDGALSAEDVEVEKKNLADLIESQLNDKRHYASLKAKEAMCAGEAYGVSEYGTAAQALAITPAALYEAYQTMLKTAGVEIILVGPADKTECESLFAEAFAAVSRGKLLRCVTDVIREPGPVRTVEERLAVNQAKLVMGFRAGTAAPESEADTMQLASAILGGTPHSKLFENVREKLGLCYYCFSYFERIKGLVFVEAGIEEQNYQKAKDEILNQLELLKKGEFSDDELSSAKLSLENSYRELNDTLYDISSWYLSQAVTSQIRTPDQTARALAEIDRGQIAPTAAKIKLDTVYLLAGERKD